MYSVFIYKETDNKFNTIDNITISSYFNKDDAIDEYFYQKQNNPDKRVVLFEKVDTGDNDGLIREAVSFKEAMEHATNGRGVYSEYNDRVYIYRNNLFEKIVDECGVPVTVGEVLHGKWYLL